MDFNECVYCERKENVDEWFAVNRDGYKVCPECEEKYGLDETVADRMYNN